MSAVFTHLPMLALVPIFLAGAAGVWGAGTKLTGATDALSRGLGLGEALGGMIFLAFATNLPEIAIAVAAGISGNVDIVTGNILGGIAVQTLILVLLDVVGGRESGRPLSYTAASLVLAIEGLLVLALLSAAVMGAQLPRSASLLRIEPAGLAIVLLWIAGLWVVSHARRDVPWSDARDDEEQDQDAGEKEHREDLGVSKAAAIFAVAALVTLVAGAALEQSSEAIAGRIGLSNVLFGATALAAATALPEVSTGLASVRLGAARLAVSDILGGNAFLPTLFFVTGLVSGRAVLAGAKAPDLYLTGLAALLSAIVVVGLIARPRRRILGMGPDSLAVLVVYVIGIAGLLLVGGS